MSIVLNNFIIETDKKIPYFDQIVNYIESNEADILSFFHLSKLSNKYHIKIIDICEFKEFIINKYGIYKNSNIADTDRKSKTIRILSYEDIMIYANYKKFTLEDYFKIFIHEFVHACHNELSNGCKEDIWFREGLAVNLAKQDYDLIDIDIDFEDLINNFRIIPNNYSYAYTIVKYILNNYSNDEIFKLISDLNYFKDKSKSIFKKLKKDNLLIKGTSK